MSLSSFAVYAFLEPDNFTAVKAFTTLALLDILRIPLGDDVTLHNAFILNP